jgi:hypothetical protein
VERLGEIYGTALGRAPCSVWQQATTVDPVLRAPRMDRLFEVYASGAWVCGCGGEWVERVGPWGVRACCAGGGGGLAITPPLRRALPSGHGHH